MVGEYVAGHQSHWHISTLWYCNLPFFQFDQVIKSFFFQYPVFFVKLFISNPDVITLFSHLNCVQDAQILYLVVGDSVHKCECLFLLIRLYASNEMKIGIGGHLSDELLHLFTNLNSQVFFVWLCFHWLKFLFKNAFNNRGLWLGEFGDDVFSQEILIFIPETFNHVFNFTGSVFDDERVSDVGGIRRWKVFMMLMIFSDVGEEVDIFDVKSAAFVEEVVNTFGWWFNKFDNFEIVGKVKLRNAWFKAFRLEYFFLLNKNLFEVNLMYFFVSKIYTKLLKTVFLEHFEPINIEEFNIIALWCWFILITFINFHIKFLNYPGEESFVNSFCHWISAFLALFRSQRYVHQLTCNHFFMED